MNPKSQATSLPHAFTTGTLHEPGAWNIDTGESYHLNSSVTSLDTVFNTCIYLSISVGDGHSIPVTNTGHSILPTATKSLHLNNVHITRHIVKNLIYVRQFVRDNNYPIEFDAFGFSIKDFLTCRVLLRCNSTGDLYPVTAPSPIPHAFLVSQHMWHQRLRHPWGEVLCHLVSYNFISYNKEKPPVLCHACQLGKHVRLLFFSSSTVISFCFDITHSDVWTSPIPSLSEDTFDIHPTISNPTLTTPTIEQTDPLPHQQHPTESAAQQSPIAAPPTPASSSSTQIHSPVQQQFPMAQHIPVKLQFSPTVVLYQSTTVSNQHAPALIQNPSVNPNPDSVHPIVTRFRVETNRPTKRLNLHVSSISPLPKSYCDAFNDPNWQNAMHDEYTALIKNKTWTLVPRPSDTNIVRCMWLFRHKYLADGTLSRYKARLVANGSTQLEGVDVDETFSPVVKPGTIQTVMSLAASRRWSIHQLDGIDTAYLLLYVDDIVLNASSEGLLQRIIGSLHQEFAMTDLGPLNYFLGISVTRDSSGLFLSQKKYDIEILEKSHMVSCNHSWAPVDTESKLGVDGDPVSDPTLYRSLAEPLLSALKRILRYVQGTLNYGLQLFSLSTTDLVAYSDADRAGCPTTRRSTSGYCVFLGNNLLSWSAKRQPTLSRSSAGAEYRGVANVVAELVG
nr:ribonuclease H-like domain-containing protein [Tanacetum cinerariifolium]